MFRSYRLRDTRSLLALFALAFSMLNGCATRKVIEENNLPQPIMNSRVELNAEYFGENYKSDAKVSLYLDASPATAQSGRFGNGGMRFHYIFEPQLKLIVDNQSYVLKSTAERSVNRLTIESVPQSLVKSIANARAVEVYATAERGRVTYKSEFTAKNRRKFQEFVQKYIDAKQPVEKRSFAERLLLPED